MASPMRHESCVKETRLLGSSWLREARVPA